MDGTAVYSAYTDAFTRLITLGHAAVLPNTMWLLLTLAVITIILAGLSMAISDGAAIPDLVRIALTIGFVIFLLQNLEALADRVMAGFTKLGLLAGGSHLDVLDFLGSPDAVMKIGDRAFYSIEGLMHSACEISFGGCLANAGNFFALFVAMLVVVVIFFLIAMAIFGTLIMFKISVLASAVSMVLIVFPRFQHVGNLALINVLRWGIQMMVLAIISSVGEAVFTNIPVGDQPGLASVLGTLTGAGVFLGLVLKSGSMASALTTGAILNGGAMLAGGGGTAAVAARMAGRGPVGAAIAGPGKAVSGGIRAALTKPGWVGK